MISLAGQKVLARVVSDAIYGLALFCLVATAYHGLLAIYITRLYRQRGNVEWLAIAQRIDYVLLVVVLGIWLAIKELR